MLDLKQYDGKCVRITDAEGNVFEGVCSYNSEEYDEHEYGRCEKALQLPFFLFFQSNIAALESLEDRSGPYGKFSDPYGTLEELMVEEGIDGDHGGFVLRRTGAHHPLAPLSGSYLCGIGIRIS